MSEIRQNICTDEEKILDFIYNDIDDAEIFAASSASSSSLVESEKTETYELTIKEVQDPGEVEKLKDELNKLRLEKEILLENISSLYKTSKAELERKDRQINNLRYENDNRLFKRNTVFRKNFHTNEEHEITNHKRFEDTNQPVRKKQLNYHNSNLNVHNLDKCRNNKIIEGKNEENYKKKIIDLTEENNDVVVCGSPCSLTPTKKDDKYKDSKSSKPARHKKLENCKVSHQDPNKTSRIFKESHEDVHTQEKNIDEVKLNYRGQEHNEVCSDLLRNPNANTKSNDLRNTFKSTHNKSEVNIESHEEVHRQENNIDEAKVNYHGQEDNEVSSHLDRVPSSNTKSHDLRNKIKSTHNKSEVNLESHKEIHRQEKNIDEAKLNCRGQEDKEVYSHLDKNPNVNTKTNDLRNKIKSTHNKSEVNVDKNSEKEKYYTKHRIEERHKSETKLNTKHESKHVENDNESAKDIKELKSSETSKTRSKEKHKNVESKLKAESKLIHQVDPPPAENEKVKDNTKDLENRVLISKDKSKLPSVSDDKNQIGSKLEINKKSELHVKESDIPPEKEIDNVEELTYNTNYKIPKKKSNVASDIYNSAHQVIKETEESSPRILSKPIKSIKHQSSDKYWTAYPGVKEQSISLKQKCTLLDECRKTKNSIKNRDQHNRRPRDYDKEYFQKKEDRFKSEHEENSKSYKSRRRSRSTSFEQEFQNLASYRETERRRPMQESKLNEIRKSRRGSIDDKSKIGNEPSKSKLSSERYFSRESYCRRSRSLSEERFSDFEDALKNLKALEKEKSHRVNSGFKNDNQHNQTKTNVHSRDLTRDREHRGSVNARRRSLSCVRENYKKVSHRDRGRSSSREKEERQYRNKYHRSGRRRSISCTRDKYDEGYHRRHKSRERRKYYKYSSDEEYINTSRYKHRANSPNKNDRYLRSGDYKRSRYRRDNMEARRRKRLTPALDIRKLRDRLIRYRHESLEKQTVGLRHKLYGDNGKHIEDAFSHVDLVKAQFSVDDEKSDMESLRISCSSPEDVENFNFLKDMDIDLDKLTDDDLTRLLAEKRKYLHRSEKTRSREVLEYVPIKARSRDSSSEVHLTDISDNCFEEHEYFNFNKSHSVKHPEIYSEVEEENQKNLDPLPSLMSCKPSSPKEDVQKYRISVENAEDKGLSIGNISDKLTMAPKQTGDSFEISEDPKCKSTRKEYDLEIFKKNIHLQTIPDIKSSNSPISSESREVKIFENSKCALKEEIIHADSNTEEINLKIMKCKDEQPETAAISDSEVSKGIQHSVKPNCIVEQTGNTPENAANTETEFSNALNNISFHEECVFDNSGRKIASNTQQSTTKLSDSSLLRDLHVTDEEDEMLDENEKIFSPEKSKEKSPSNITSCSRIQILQQVVVTPPCALSNAKSYTPPLPAVKNDECIKHIRREVTGKEPTPKAVVDKSCSVTKVESFTPPLPAVENDECIENIIKEVTGKGLVSEALLNTSSNIVSLSTSVQLNAEELQKCLEGDSGKEEPENIKQSARQVISKVPYSSCKTSDEPNIHKSDKRSRHLGVQISLENLDAEKFPNRNSTDKSSTKATITAEKTKTKPRSRKSKKVVEEVKPPNSPNVPEISFKVRDKFDSQEASSKEITRKKRTTTGRKKKESKNIEKETPTNMEPEIQEQGRQMHPQTFFNCPTYIPEHNLFDSPNTYIRNKNLENPRKGKIPVYDKNSEINSPNLNEASQHKDISVVSENKQDILLHAAEKSNNKPQTESSSKTSTSGGKKRKASQNDCKSLFKFNVEGLIKGKNPKRKPNEAKQKKCKENMKQITISDSFSTMNVSQIIHDVVTKESEKIGAKAAKKIPVKTTKRSNRRIINVQKLESVETPKHSSSEIIESSKTREIYQAMELQHKKSIENVIENISVSEVKTDTDSNISKPIKKVQSPALSKGIRRKRSSSEDTEKMSKVLKMSNHGTVSPLVSPREILYTSKEISDRKVTNDTVSEKNIKQASVDFDLNKQQGTKENVLYKEPAKLTSPLHKFEDLQRQLEKSVGLATDSLPPHFESDTKLTNDINLISSSGTVGQCPEEISSHHLTLSNLPEPVQHEYEKLLQQFELEGIQVDENKSPEAKKNNMCINKDDKLKHEEDQFTFKNILNKSENTSTPIKNRETYLKNEARLAQYSPISPASTINTIGFTETVEEVIGNLNSDNSKSVPVDPTTNNIEIKSSQVQTSSFSVHNKMNIKVESNESTSKTENTMGQSSLSTSITPVGAGGPVWRYNRRRIKLKGYIIQ